MNSTTAWLIEKVDYSHPSLKEVIKFAIGYPTEDKVQQVIKSYRSTLTNIFGAFNQQQLIGAIAVEIHGMKAIICHISVLPEFRKQGIGKALIHFIIKKFKIQELCAKTDQDAVEFYQKLGFKCYLYINKPQTRYQCIYKTVSEN